MDDEGREDEMVPRSKVVLRLAFSESPSNLVHVHCMLQYIALAPLAGKLLPVIRTTANMVHGTVQSVNSRIKREPYYILGPFLD